MECVQTSVCRPFGSLSLGNVADAKRTRRTENRPPLLIQLLVPVCLWICAQATHNMPRPRCALREALGAPCTTARAQLIWSLPVRQSLVGKFSDRHLDVFTHALVSPVPHFAFWRLFCLCHRGIIKLRGAAKQSCHTPGRIESTKAWGRVWGH